MVARRRKVRGARFGTAALIVSALGVVACEIAFPTSELSSGAAPAGVAGNGAQGGSAGSAGHGGAAGHPPLLVDASGCECVPDETEQAACGKCGQRFRVCNDDCTWALFGDCGGEGACAPGDTSTLPCGKCGHKTRLCDATCAWGDYGACSDEGECTPNETSDLPCGNCGHKTRKCDATCTWGGYGGCTGEGPCHPGDPPKGCGQCLEQTCTGTCTWGGCEKASWAACTDQTGTKFNCCGAGHWQFCNKATCQFYGCAVCSGPCAECG